MHPRYGMGFNAAHRASSYSGHLSAARSSGSACSSYWRLCQRLRGEIKRPGLSEPQTIRGGNLTRPRAADDFGTIRARMEELRRERAQGQKPGGDPRMAARQTTGAEDLSRREAVRALTGGRHDGERWPRGPSGR